MSKQKETNPFDKFFTDADSYACIWIDGEECKAISKLGNAKFKEILGVINALNTLSTKLASEALKQGSVMDTMMVLQLLQDDEQKKERVNTKSFGRKSGGLND